MKTINYFDYLKNFILSYIVLIICINIHQHICDPFEAGAYLNYMQSFINDGDLNIINNIAKPMAWVISKTYNYPDMHDHGASLIWAPLYAFGKLVNSVLPFGTFTLESKFSTTDYSLIVVYIMNLFLGLLGVKLFKHLLLNHFKLSLNNFSIFVVLFGTGLFNFLIYQFSTADVTHFFYTALFLFVLANISPEWSLFKFFLLGVLFAFGSVVKLSFPMMLPAVFFFYYNNMKIELKKSTLDLVLFSLGSLAILGLKLINNKIKFGFESLVQGYNYAYRPSFFGSPIEHWRCFFGPAGTFTTSPLSFLLTAMLIILIIFALFNFKKISKANLFFIAIGMSYLAKHFLNLFVIYEGNTGYGSRHYISDTGVYLSMMAIIYSKHFELKKYLGHFNKFFIFCLIWTAIIYFWWLEVVTYPVQVFNAFYIQKFSIVSDQVISKLINLKNLLFHFPMNLYINLRYAILLIPISIIWTLVNEKLKREKASNSIISTGLLVLISYSCITGINYYFTNKNVDTMKAQGFYSQMVIGNGQDVFLYDEYVSVFAICMDIAKLNRNRELHDYYKKILMELLEATKKEITFDPVGFRQMLDPGHLKSDELDFKTSDVNSIFNFDSPTMYIRRWENQN